MKKVGQLDLERLLVHDDELVYCKIMMINGWTKEPGDKTISVSGGFHILFVK